MDEQHWDAEAYERDLQRGLDLAGEDADFFAEERVAHTAARVPAPSTVVEFGCGTGNNLRFLARRFPDARLIGLDPSEAMLELARQRLAGTPVELSTVAAFSGAGSADLVFVNGVFHHIPAERHAAELGRLRGWLAAGGSLVLFDNNPWNPGARWVMRRIPFDRDAVMVSPFRLARQLSDLDFASVRTRFFFLFPNALRALRGLEPWLERWPLGAQYAVFARVG